jgi:hypothetical protein
MPPKKSCLQNSMEAGIMSSPTRRQSRRESVAIIQDPLNRSAGKEQHRGDNSTYQSGWIRRREASQQDSSSQAQMLIGGLGRLYFDIFNTQPTCSAIAASELFTYEVAIHTRTISCWLDTERNSQMMSASLTMDAIANTFFEHQPITWCHLQRKPINILEAF